MPELFKVAFETASNEQMTLMLAKYDARNPDALRRMIGEGTQLRLFPRPVMDACYKASFEVFDELAAKDADFKTIYVPWKRFLESSNPWFRVAEQSLDAYRFAHDIPPSP